MFINENLFYFIYLLILSKFNKISSILLYSFISILYSYDFCKIARRLVDILIESIIILLLIFSRF